MAGPIEATVRINADKLDMRVRDLELAVGELANLVERLIIAEPKRWKGEERKAMLFAVDNARALATPEDGDDDPEPEPPTVFGMPVVATEAMPDGVVAVAIDGDSRYWIDLTSGDGFATNDFEVVADWYVRGEVRHASDRKLGRLLVYNGKQEPAYSAAVVDAVLAEAA